MSGNILILSRYKYKETGNSTTTTRLRQHFEFLALKCYVKDPEWFISKDFLSAFIQQNEIKCIFAIHCVHCKLLLRGLCIPYVLIFGGTDVNEPSEKHSLTISAIVKEAQILVAFNEALKERALKLWPDLDSNKIHVIPQAVNTFPSKFSIKHHLQVHFKITCRHVVLLICGIRPVKDPFFILKDFEEWHLNHQDIFLIIIGPIIDEFYHTALKNFLSNVKGIILMSPIPQCDVHAAIRDSFVLVNTSVSEGMSSAILEAMDLKIPVLARNIPGNASVIDHGETGLLFESGNEFVMQLEKLVLDKKLYQNIINNAKQQIIARHQCSKEAESYKQILEEVLKEET